MAEKLAKNEFGGTSFAAFIPSCEKDGSYSKAQCLPSSGVCWCVNENGEEIPGTKVKGKLNCDEGLLRDHRQVLCMSMY